MPPPPEVIQELFGDTTPIADALETSATYEFNASDGSRHKAPVWLVRDEAKLHLIAAVGAFHWRFGVAAASDVSVASGLTRDTIRVGPYEIPLKRRTKAAAETIAAAFRETAQGEPFAAPPRGEPGSVLDGAIGLPTWWAATVGGDVDDPWMMAVRSATDAALFDFDGAVREEPIYVGLTAVRTTIAAYRSDDLTFVRDVEGEVKRVERLGKDELHIGEWVGSMSDADCDLLCDVLEHVGAKRVARILSYACERCSLDTILGLVEHLVAIDGVALGAADLATLAWALDEPERALAYLGLIVLGEAVPTASQRGSGFRGLVDGALAIVSKPILKTSFADAKTKASRVRSLLGKASPEQTARLKQAVRAPSVPPLTVPRDFPWPPEQLTELWSVATALAGDIASAMILLEPIEEPRRMLARASLRNDSDSEGADGWRTVATAYAYEGDYESARRFLVRAVESDPRPADHVVDAGWAWLAESEDDAKAAFGRALDTSVPKNQLQRDDLDRLVDILQSVDVDAHRSEETSLLDRARSVFGKNTEDPKPTRAALMAFCEVAREAEAYGVAATLTARSEELHPSLPAEVQRLAERCAKTFRSPRTGARLLEALARRLEDESKESAPIWLRAGALRAAAGDVEEAHAALGSALAVDFLRPETYYAALATPGAALPESVAAWWRHLAGVMAGDGGPFVPTDVAEVLDARTLDGLHPGGVGWVDNLRHAVHEAQPPTYATLVRGLERLGEDRHPEVWNIVSSVSAALGIEPPQCFLYRGDDAYGACVWPIDQPVLLIGYRHLDEGPHHLSSAALRFVIAVELSHLACRHPILSFESNLLGTSHSVYQTLGRYAGTAESVVDVVTLIPGVDQLAKLQKIVRISRRVFATKSAVDKIGKVAGPLAKLLPGEERAKGIGRDKLEGAALQFRLQADRAALLLTGSFAAAVEAILKSRGVLDAADHARTRGLASTLQTMAHLEPADVLRLSSLAEFAVRRMPGPISG